MRRSRFFAHIADKRKHRASVQLRCIIFSKTPKLVKGDLALMNNAQIGVQKNRRRRARFSSSQSLNAAVSFCKLWNSERQEQRRKKASCVIEQEPIQLQPQIKPECKTLDPGTVQVQSCDQAATLVHTNWQIINKSRLFWELTLLISIQRLQLMCLLLGMFNTTIFQTDTEYRYH